MDINQTKEQLIAKTNAYKSAVQNQVNNLGEDLEGTARKAVFVLGAVIAAAIVIKIISPKKPKVVRDPNSEALTLVQESENPIVSMIKGAIMSFLLNMARERIVNFLEELNKSHSNAASGSSVSAD